MHMDISLYEQQVEELNRKLTFQRSRYLKEEYEHYRITDMQSRGSPIYSSTPAPQSVLSQRHCTPMQAICRLSAKSWSTAAI